MYRHPLEHILISILKEEGLQFSLTLASKELLEKIKKAAITSSPIITFLEK